MHNAEMSDKMGRKSYSGGENKEITWTPAVMATAGWLR